MAGWYFSELPSRQLNQMGDVDDNPVHMCAEETFWTIAKVAFLWGRSSGTSGEHPKGLALDFSVLEYGGGVNNPGPARAWMGNKVANWLWANRARLGIWYIIWDRKIISSNRYSYAYNRWVDYRGSNPHTDHVHASYYSANIYQPPAVIPKPDPEPLPPEDQLNTEDKQWIAGQIDTAVTTAVNRAVREVTDELVAKAVSAVQASEQRTKQHVTRRTLARINEETAATYGYGDKTEYQVGAMAADGSWQTRALRLEVAELASDVTEARDAILAKFEPPPEVPEPEPPTEPEPTPAADEAQS